MERPVIVKQGKFSSTVAPLPSDVVMNIRFPDILFQKSVNLVQKLNYFLYFRANVHIKIVFNATPFMQGKYWAFFVPFDTETNRTVQGNIQNQTGYNGTEIDICSGAPVNLMIPYCSSLSHYNLVSQESTMGNLYITTLNPITSGSSSTEASYTVFAWFEKIELHVPTSLPVVVPTLASGFKAQMFTEELAKTNGAPVSGIMNTIGSIAKNISGISPRLATVAKPVEWIARFFAGGLAANGFNKPTSLDQNTTIENLPAKGYTHIDGVDRSVKLAAMPDNALVQHSGLFSSSMDEMDINYITSKSCVMVSNKEWKTTDVVGTKLVTINVTPGACVSDPTINSTYNTTMCSFVSSMFQMWRGGLVYRMAVSKTAYHSGRLRISFHPGIYNVTGTGDSSFVYNQILDLSVSSEIEFTIPYVSNTPWKYNEIFDYTGVISKEYCTGIVVLEVLTPLVIASDSVSNVVQYNVWISGASDLSFAVPNFSNHVIGQATPLTPASVSAFALNKTVKLSDLSNVDDNDIVRLIDGTRICKEDFLTLFDDDTDIDNNVMYAPDFSGVFYAQIFNTTEPAVSHNEQIDDSSFNFFNMKTVDPTSGEELCIGEKITNLRQIIKRFSPIYQVLNNKTIINALGSTAVPLGSSLNNDGKLNLLRIDPAFFGVDNGNTGATFQNYNLYDGFDTASGSGNLTPCQVARNLPTYCPLHYISFIYKFYRGSKRYKYFFSDFRTVENYTTTKSTLRNPYPYCAARSQAPSINGGILQPTLTVSQTNFADLPTFSTIIYPDLNGALEFEAPYYAQTPISIVGQGTITQVEGPLVTRNYIYIQQGFGDNDYPNYTKTGTQVKPDSSNTVYRYPFNGGTLMTAAGDDFNFGYLIGSPSVRRIGNILF